MLMCRTALNSCLVRADDVLENVARANHAVTTNRPVAISTDSNVTGSLLLDKDSSSKGVVAERAAGCFTCIDGRAGDVAVVLVWDTPEGGLGDILEEVGGDETEF